VTPLCPEIRKVTASGISVTTLAAQSRVGKWFLRHRHLADPDQRARGFLTAGFWTKKGPVVAGRALEVLGEDA
jgi:hypothetical protein